MKKTLGVLVLTLSSLVISAACASASASSKPKPPRPNLGENWAKAGLSQLPSRTASSAAQTGAAADEDGRFGLRESQK